MYRPCLGLSFCVVLAVVAMSCAPSSETSPSLEAAIDAAVSDLVAQHPEATVAVAVRDPSTETIYNRNADRSFHAASTMKVPVMLEVYRQAALGRFALDDPLEVKNDFASIVDGSRYRIEDDSDDAIYTRLGETMTIRELVYNMITVSSNLATNLLIDFISADSVQATSERLGTTSMRVLRGVEDIKAYRQGLSNTTTAADLAILLHALQEHRVVSSEQDQAMVDVMLAQAFNEMIPAQLPEGTQVAHKTGWITEIHHDAGIVYPDHGEPYVLVILTEGIADPDVSAPLGAAIAAAIHGILRPTP